MELPEEVKKILRTLNAAGFEAYAVGGCVRDSCLGRRPGDWDLTTDAPPQEVKKLFRRTLDTGIEHGTVTVMLGKTGYEITTYRLEGAYSDGRHPDYVIYTSKLGEDLARRDFTINAMACGLQGEVIDLFGGERDLRDGLIRCVGSAGERFREDALRMLRAIRFSAQLNFKIEEKTWEALCENVSRMGKVSRERILTELNKTLLSDHPEKLALLCSSGMGEHLGFEAESLLCPERMAALPRRRELRWAALCSELSPERACEILQGLKSDLETRSRVGLLVRELGRALPGDRSGMRALLAKIGAERCGDLICLKRAGFGRPESAAAILEADRMKREILEAGDCVSLKTMAVSGKDLIRAGMKPGPEIGEALSFLFELVLREPELNRRELLLERLRERRGPSEANART